MKIATRHSAAALILLALLAWQQPSLAQQSPEIRTSKATPEIGVMKRAVDGEPSVRDVQKAALRASGLGSARDRSWASRARWAHLLPEVSGEIAWLDQRDIEISYQEDIESADDGQMIRDSARNDFVDDERLRSIYAIEATWDLSGLVFDPEELDAARAAERRHLARLEILQMVSAAYFERRKWQVELVLTPAADLRKRIRARLALQRATADLDAMTVGWFSKTLQRGGGPR